MIWLKKKNQNFHHQCPSILWLNQHLLHAYITWDSANRALVEFSKGYMSFRLFQIANWEFHAIAICCFCDVCWWIVPFGHGPLCDFLHIIAILAISRCYQLFIWLCASAIKPLGDVWCNLKIFSVCWFVPFGHVFFFFFF